MKKHSAKKMILAALLLALALTLTACGSSGSGSRSNSGSGSGSRSNSGSGSGRKCAFKENGRSVCSSPAAAGSNFCSYHQG